MPEDRPVPGSPQDWLAHARSDLTFARLPLPEGAFYEGLCFHAQQAAEKALKAVYQYYGWMFRYTHDLEELVSALIRRPQSANAVSEKIMSFTRFTPRRKSWIKHRTRCR
jgi:HEPN domain-containing protein